MTESFDSCRLHLLSHDLFKRCDSLSSYSSINRFLYVSKKAEVDQEMIYILITSQRSVWSSSRVWALVFFQFHNKDDGKSCVNEYDTNIMSRFVCRNSSCSAQVWTSKQIVITIRKYSNNRYNARIYHQFCKNCKTSSKSKLNHSYAERVAYRIKKWCEVQMNAFFFSSQSENSHRSDLCKRCKQDHCNEMKLKS